MVEIEKIVKFSSYTLKIVNILALAIIDRQYNNDRNNINRQLKCQKVDKKL